MRLVLNRNVALVQLVELEIGFSATGISKTGRALSCHAKETILFAFLEQKTRILNVLHCYPEYP